MAKTSVIHVAVNPEMKRNLTKLAKEQDVPVSWIIRRALHVELNKVRA